MQLVVVLSVEFQHTHHNIDIFEVINSRAIDQQMTLN